MPASFLEIGKPAHDRERQAIAWLVENLPKETTVYGNPWLVERSGVIYELDAVVVAPHAVFVVEVKSYTGKVEGTDYDWWLPEKIRSPLQLNRRTAQVLKSQLRAQSFAAGQTWVEHFVFLSSTTDVGVRGPASQDRVHTKKTILAALQDRALVDRLSQNRTSASTAAAQGELLKMFQALPKDRPPPRRLREYELLETVDRQETYAELRARHGISGVERLLRLYALPPSATDEQRKRLEGRARWEAQTLGRLGSVPGILHADPPFLDEAGLVIPFEHFAGITLTTWIENFGPQTKGKTRADLDRRLALWEKLASTIDGAHAQGVVHRLLRPEVVLVENDARAGDFRVTGFELAKQLTTDTAWSPTTLADDRLTIAAPEVVSALRAATPASDQFSLGALLALLLTGTLPFESTRQLVAQNRLVRRVRDLDPRLPLRLDEAVARMLALAPSDRFASLKEARDAVKAAVAREPATATSVSTPPPQLDPEALPPGAVIGTDYEIVALLGQGGLSVVYSARHLMSNRLRALKIARADTAAEQALVQEFEALGKLDHANIVKALDLSKMLAGRLTLVLERVGDETLRAWNARHLKPELPARRRLAEDLLAGLEYLENQGVSHKDLKPDNLLVSGGRLTIIDFSLAGMPADAPWGGTALYSDPGSRLFGAASDRFAAALCLFELYVGRHAFDGTVPPPGELPVLQDEELELPALAPFFRRALDPIPEKRFPSARALRDGLLAALGEGSEPAATPRAEEGLTTDTPLQLVSDVPARARNVLARGQVTTVGGLLAMSDAQLCSLHSLGRKTVGELLRARDALRERGLQTKAGGRTTSEPAIVPGLVDATEPVASLEVRPAIHGLLTGAGLRTVGAVAGLTRPQLYGLPKLSRQKAAEVVEALLKLEAKRDEAPAPTSRTLDAVWADASAELTHEERTCVERTLGLQGEPETQAVVAAAIGRDQPFVSTTTNRGIDRLQRDLLRPLREAVDDLLTNFGGLASLDKLGERLEESWPGGDVRGAGLVRLLVRIAAGELALHTVDGADHPIVAQSSWDRESVAGFLREALRLASQWPPLEPETARRTLRAHLPNFPHDPMTLAMRLASDVRVAATGHLFVAPLDARQSIAFVLEQARDELTLGELRLRVEATFGPDTPFPHASTDLLELLQELGRKVEGERIVSARGASIVAGAPLPPDAPPIAPAAAKSEAERLRDALLQASTSRGFRLVVTPPERHAELGRSLAKSLGLRFLSFERAFFEEHDAQLAQLERAERFAAQRYKLNEAAETTFRRLFEQHGRPGERVVLGDTALLQLCGQLDLARHLYDETLSGTHGFWLLVVPGVVHQQQPHFNEQVAMWHLPGTTLSLFEPLPPPAAAP